MSFNDISTDKIIVRNQESDISSFPSLNKPDVPEIDLEDKIVEKIATKKEIVEGNNRGFLILLAVGIGLIFLMKAQKK